MRPGYEGSRSAERRGACEAPGCCEHPGTLVRRATSPCDREVRLSALHCGDFRPIGPRLRASGSNLAGSRSASSSRTGRFIARVAESRAPGVRLTRPNRGHRILLHLPFVFRKTPLSEQNGGRYTTPGVEDGVSFQKKNRAGRGGRSGKFRAAPQANAGGVRLFNSPRSPGRRAECDCRGPRCHGPRPGSSRRRLTGRRAPDPSSGARPGLH